MFDFNRTSSSRTHRAALCLLKDVRAMRAAIVVGLVVAGFAFLVGPRAIQAQVLYGSLTGNVTDPKGAAVPGAKLDLVNASTSAGKSTVSDGRGGYSFSDLQAGVYKLTISLTGFKTSIKDDLKVEANKTYRFDAQLEVGEVKETVVISAAAEVPLQTDRADVNLTQSA